MDSKVDEREYRLIHEISKNGDASQRVLSEKVGLSLGMVNIILKRLVGKGLVKISQLDGRKVQYILTPEGFAEKVKKSYSFLWKTIDRVKIMKAKIQEIVLSQYQKGERDFVIIGEGELPDLIELAIRDLKNDGLKYERFSDIKELPEERDCVVLAADGKIERPKAIDVSAELAGLE